jgi:RNA polymerase sigma-70 factor (ECF subfamily)
MRTGSLKAMDYESDDQQPAAPSDERGQYWVICLEKVASTQDVKAFSELFEHFSPMIKSFAYKIPGLEQAEPFAEELLQETMLKVWTKAASFDARLASPSTWIFTIARNMRIDLLRKQARHVINNVQLYQDGDDDEIALDDIWFEDENSDVFNQLAMQRSRKQIHESLKLLPIEQTEVLSKVYLEDKSHAEVAAELKLPLGTVKSRVRLALNKLKLVVDR